MVCREWTGNLVRISSLPIKYITRLIYGLDVHSVFQCSVLRPLIVWKWRALYFRIVFLVKTKCMSKGSTSSSSTAMFMLKDLKWKMETAHRNFSCICIYEDMITLKRSDLTFPPLFLLTYFFIAFCHRMSCHITLLFNILDSWLPQDRYPHLSFIIFFLF